jgi:hypothetical protein
MTMWIRVLIGAGLGVVVGGVGGFLLGASVPDENAGQVAVWLSSRAALALGLLGAAIALGSVFLFGV